MRSGFRSLEFLIFADFLVRITKRLGVTFKRFSMARFLIAAKRFLKSEDGPTAVEYAVMLALSVVVCLTAVTSIGTNSKATFQKVTTTLQTANS